VEDLETLLEQLVILAQVREQLDQQEMVVALLLIKVVEVEVLKLDQLVQILVALEDQVLLL